MDMGKKLTKQRVRERIENLKKEINRHRYLYHVLDQQEISDAALDSLKKELEQLEYQFPEFVTSDSPTQRIGGKARAELPKSGMRYPCFHSTTCSLKAIFFLG